MIIALFVIQLTLYTAPRLHHEPPDYWPFAREYSIWNPAVTALQLWTADSKSHIPSDAIE